MSDRHRVVVAGLIWRFRPAQGNDVPEFLIMKRPPDAPFFPNVWVAPGGGVETADMESGPAGECGVRALYRELGEELGIGIGVEKPWLLCHRGFVRSDRTGVFVLTYLCKLAFGEPVVTAEAVEFAWVTEAETGSYDLIGDTAAEIEAATRQVEPF